ncbi:Golgin candidate 6 [Glycine soja]
MADCLELLNNFLSSNAFNQTVGLDSLILILKLRGSSFTFNQQKGGSESDPGKDMNKQKNKTTLKKVLDHLLILGVESQWVPVPICCAAMQCIGDLIVGDSKNRDLLASKVLREEPHVEPTLNSILRILLRTSSMQEFIVADYIFKSFCKKNDDGQSILASTLIPQPYSMNHVFLKEDVNMPFGRSSAASMADIKDVHGNDLSEKKNLDHPILSSILDSNFMNLVKSLEADIREQIVDVYSRPKMKDLVLRNASMAEDLAKTSSTLQPEQRVSGGLDRVPIDTLHRDLQEASQRLNMISHIPWNGFLEFEAIIFLVDTLKTKIAM